MPITREFKTTLKATPVGGLTAYIEVPFSVKDVFGTNGLVPVKVTINDVTYRSSLSNMGMGCHIIPVRREICEKAEVRAGLTVDVKVVHDTAPRTVTAPPELKKIFAKNKRANAAWAAASFTSKKEWAEAIRGAKQEETRERRLKKIVAELEARAEKLKATTRRGR